MIAIKMKKLYQKYNLKTTLVIRKEIQEKIHKRRKAEANLP
jgi:hypothetical protein